MLALWRYVLQEYTGSPTHISNVKKTFTCCTQTQSFKQHTAYVLTSVLSVSSRSLHNVTATRLVLVLHSPSAVRYTCRIRFTRMCLSVEVHNVYLSPIHEISALLVCLTIECPQLICTKRDHVLRMLWCQSSNNYSTDQQNTQQGINKNKKVRYLIVMCIFYLL